MSLFRSGRGGAVHVAVVRDQVERGVGGVLGKPPVDGSAGVTDGDVTKDPVEEEVENGDREQAEAPGPGDEYGADGDQRNARCPVEVLLDVELSLGTGSARLDGGAGLGKHDPMGRGAIRTGNLAREVGAEANLAAGAEEMDRRHRGPS